MAKCLAAVGHPCDKGQAATAGQGANGDRLTILPNLPMCARTPRRLLGHASCRRADRLRMYCQRGASAKSQPSILPRRGAHARSTCGLVQTMRTCSPVRLASWLLWLGFWGGKGSWGQEREGRGRGAVLHSTPKSPAWEGEGVECGQGWVDGGSEWYVPPKWRCRTNWGGIGYKDSGERGEGKGVTEERTRDRLFSVCFSGRLHGWSLPFGGQGGCGRASRAGGGSGLQWQGARGKWRTTGCLPGDSDPRRGAGKL